MPFMFKISAKCNHLLQLFLLKMKTAPWLNSQSKNFFYILGYVYIYDSVVILKDLKKILNSVFVLIEERS